MKTTRTRLTTAALLALLTTLSASAHAACPPPPDSPFDVVTVQCAIVSTLWQIDFAVRDYSVRRDDFPRSQSITDLAGQLRTPMPVVDPWGNPYRYAAVDTDFRVASAGPDGEWERRRLSSYEPGEPAGDDIVLSSGKLLTK